MCKNKAMSLATHQQVRHETDYAIIGGGIVGLCLAYALSTFAKVSLFEQGVIAGQGASAVPVALLNPYRGYSARASLHDVAGLEAMLALKEALEKEGHASGIYTTGVLRIALSPRQAKKWRSLVPTYLETQDFLQAYQGYHAPYGGFCVAKGAYIDTSVLLKSLRQAIIERGGQVLEQQGISQLDDDGNCVTLSSASLSITAKKAFVCTGAWRNLNIKLPSFESMAGDVIALDASYLDSPLNYPIAGAVYGAALKKTFFIGGNHRDDTPDPSAAAQLQNAAAWFMPQLKEAKLLSTWSGVRAKRENLLPLVEDLSPNITFVGAFAGRGFLCSALYAQDIAATLKPKF